MAGRIIPALDSVSVVTSECFLRRWVSLSLQSVMPYEVSVLVRPESLWMLCTAMGQAWDAVRERLHVDYTRTKVCKVLWVPQIIILFLSCRDLPYVLLLEGVDLPSF